MSLYQQPHTTQSIIMVRPLDFGYNEQTGTDNEFQHKPAAHQSAEITAKSLAEFSAMVTLLEQNQIEVLVLNKSHTNAKLPDAVFPNNWFSTRADGKVFIYPMKTHNRQQEVQIDALLDALKKANYSVSQVIDLRQQYGVDVALEGTGSLIFHHPDAKIFATYSERCQPQALAKFSQDYGYQCFGFDSRSDKGRAIYHTNVLMSCGTNFAVIAKKTINKANAASQAIKALEDSVEDIVEISQVQMAENFCGNIIQLHNQQGQPCIVMSASAYRGFTRNQLKTIEKHGYLIVCELPTIEYIGGGSARCMIAENFLTR